MLKFQRALCQYTNISLRARRTMGSLETVVEGDTKKRELLKKPTKIVEIQ
jgi:hypothetical protein